MNIPLFCELRNFSRAYVARAARIKTAVSPAQNNPNFAQTEQSPS